MLTLTQNVQQLVEDDDLNNDNPVFQQALLFRHILPHRWITEVLAQLQAREGAGTRGQKETRWGHFHCAGLDSLEAWAGRAGKVLANYT